MRSLSVDRSRQPQKPSSLTTQVAHLRIRHEVDVLAEGAVVVDSYGAGEEDAITPAELLLAVSAEGGVRLEVLRPLPHGGGSGRR